MPASSKIKLAFLGLVISVLASLVLASVSLVNLGKVAAEQKELRDALASIDSELEGLRNQLAQQSPTVKDPIPVADPDQKLVKVIESEGFSVSLEVCDRSGSVTYCKFSIESHFGERGFTISAMPDVPSQVMTTRAVDEFGNTYQAQAAGLGTEEGQLPTAAIPSGTPVSAWVVFRDVSPDAKIFAHLDLFSLLPGFKYFKFNGVPLV